jgi:hypothetical protein
MKEEAENYLRSAYRIDLSPSTVAKDKKLADIAEVEGKDDDDNVAKHQAPTESSK